MIYKYLTFVTASLRSVTLPCTAHIYCRCKDNQNFYLITIISQKKFLLYFFSNKPRKNTE